MKYGMTTVGAMVAALLLCAGTAAAAPRGWSTDYQGARAAARATGKHVLLAIVDSANCYASRAFKRNVIDNEGWADWREGNAESLLLVWWDRAEIPERTWSETAFLFSSGGESASLSTPLVAVFSPDGMRVGPVINDTDVLLDFDEFTTAVDECLGEWADMPSGTLVWPTVTQASGQRARWSLDYYGSRDKGLAKQWPVLVAIVDSGVASATTEAWVRGVLMSEEWQDWLDSTNILLVWWDRAKISRAQWDKVAFLFASGEGGIVLPQMVLFDTNGLKVDQFLAVNDGVDNLVRADEFIDRLDNALEWDGLQIGPGWVGFTDPAQTVSATTNAVTVTVKRWGGASEGAQTFRVFTVSGSETNAAVAGIHYKSVNASVSWAAGESGEKTVIVPLLDGADAIVTQRVFHVRLEKGAGATAKLGTTSHAVTIDYGAGMIGFTTNALTVYTGTTNVEVTVKRSGGALGKQAVTLKTQAAGNVTNYVEAVTTNLVWASGELGDKQVLISLNGDALNPWAALLEQNFSVMLSKGTNVTATFGITNLTVKFQSSVTSTGGWKNDGANVWQVDTNTAPVSELTWTAPEAGLLTFKAETTDPRGRLEVDVPGASPPINTLVVALPDSALPVSSETNTFLSLALPVRPSVGTQTPLTLNLPPDTTSVTTNGTIMPIMKGDLLSTNVTVTTTLVVPTDVPSSVAETNNVELLGLGGAKSDAKASTIVKLEATDSGVLAITTMALNGTDGDLSRTATNTVATSSTTKNVSLLLTNGTAMASFDVTLVFSNGWVTVTREIAMEAPNDSDMSDITKTFKLTVTNDTTSAEVYHKVRLVMTNNEAIAVISLEALEGTPKTAITNKLSLSFNSSDKTALVLTNGLAHTVNTATLKVANGEPSLIFDAELIIPNEASEKIVAPTMALAVTNGALTAASDHTVTLTVTNGQASAIAVSTVESSETGGYETVTNTVSLDAVASSVASTNMTQVVTNGTAVAIYTVTLSMNSGAASVTAEAVLAFIEENQTGCKTETMTLAVTNDNLSAISSHDMTLETAADAASVTVVSTVKPGDSGAPASVTHTVALNGISASSVVSTNMTQVMTNGTAVATHTVTLSVSNGVASVAAVAVLRVADDERVAAVSNTVALAAGARVAWRAISTKCTVVMEWQPLAVPMPTAPADGATFSLSASPDLVWTASTNGIVCLSYGNAANALNTTQTNALSGVNAAVLGLSNVVNYWRVDSVVSGDFGTSARAEGPTWSFNFLKQSEAPVAPPPVAANASPNIVLYQYVPARIPMAERLKAVHGAARRYTAKGLPRGLKIDASTGIIAGTPKRAGTFRATVKTKTSGTTSAVELEIEVLPCPAFALGEFQGVVLDEASRVRGALVLKVSKSGALSGKLESGGRRQSLRGAWVEGDEQAWTVRLTAGRAEAMVLALTSEGAEGVTVEGWRVLARQVASPQAAQQVAGAYTAVLHAEAGDTPGLPAGYGFVTYTVASRTRSVKYGGLLADGTRVSGSAKIVAGDEAGAALFPLYKGLYARRGEVSGVVASTPDGSVVFGQGGWLNPGGSRQGSRVPFDAALDGVGARYAQPADWRMLDGAWLTADGRPFATLSAAGGKLLAQTAGVTFSLTKQSGIFAGRFTDETNTARTFKGVYMPALLYGAGFYLCPDSGDGATPCSLPVELEQ